MTTFWNCKNRNRLLLAALLLCAALLSGCAPKKAEAPAPKTLYASFYPIYALSAPLFEDVPDMRLYCLVQPQDGCLRSYTLSDWDAALVGGADAVILGGRGLESFETVFSGGSIPVVTAMGGLTLMENGASSDEEDHFSGENPWLFLSVSGAKDISASAAGAMQTLDPQYAHLYERNYIAFAEKLDALKTDMLSELDGLSIPPAILLQEGLVYFAREMGVPEYASISREAGEDRADNDLAELFSQMEATGYRLVLIERQAPDALVRAIEAEGYTVCKLDILSTRFSVDGGEGYFTAMLENAKALHEALSAEP